MLQRLKVTSYALLILFVLILPSQAVAQVLASPGIAHRQSATKLTASQKALLTIEEYIKETGASYCIAIAPELNRQGKAEGTDWNYLRRCEQGLRNFQRGMVPNPSAPGGWVNCASSQRHGAFSSSCVGAWADLFVDPMGVAPVDPMGVAPISPMGVAPVAAQDNMGACEPVERIRNMKDTARHSDYTVWAERCQVSGSKGQCENRTEWPVGNGGRCEKNSPLLP